MPARVARKPKISVKNEGDNSRPGLLLSGLHDEDWPLLWGELTKQLIMAGGGACSHSCPCSYMGFVPSHTSLVCECLTLSVMDPLENAE